MGCESSKGTGTETIVAAEHKIELTDKQVGLFMH